MKNMMETLLKILETQGVYGYVIVIVITGGLFMAFIALKWFLKSLDKRDDTQTKMIDSFTSSLEKQREVHRETSREQVQIFLDAIKEYFKGFHEKNETLHEGTRELIKKKFEQFDRR